MYRCLEEGSLLDIEGLPNFPKSLEGLRKAASGEQSFDVKDLFNTSLESETLKETLFRQAKTQVRMWLEFRCRDMKDDGTRRDESMFIIRTNDDHQALLVETAPSSSLINIRSGSEMEHR